MSARNRTLTRVLSLMRVLEAGGRHQLYPLACQLGVSVRTLRRDFHALEEAGFAIAHELNLDDNAGYWWLLQSPRRQPAFRASERQQSATSDAPGYFDR